MLGVLEIGSQSQISKRPIIINCYLYRVLCCFQDTFTCLLTCNTHNNFGRWVSSSFYRERKWTSDSDWLSQVTEDRKVKKLRLKLPHFKFRLPLINIYTYIYIYIYGEGNGTPLQYSCLQNPMDGGAWWAAVNGVAKSRTRLSGFTFTFHFNALEKEMATHSSVLAWRIPGMGEPGGLPSMGSHRVRHDWSDLAVAVAVAARCEQEKYNDCGKVQYFKRIPYLEYFFLILKTLRTLAVIEIVS